MDLSKARVVGADKADPQEHSVMYPVDLLKVRSFYILHLDPFRANYGV